MDVETLLRAAREAQGIKSNYALTRVLGVTDKTMQRWSTGANTPSNAQACELAQMAGIEPGYIMACMEGIRAKSEKDRERWSEIAKRLKSAAGTAAASAAVVASAALEALERGAGLCIMSTRRRGVDALTPGALPSAS